MFIQEAIEPKLHSRTAEYHFRLRDPFRGSRLSLSVRCGYPCALYRG